MVDFSGDLQAVIERVNALKKQLTNNPSGIYNNVRNRLDVIDAKLDIITEVKFDPNGDLTGTTASQTVAKIQGVPVSGATPTDGYIFAFESSQWTNKLSSADTSATTSENIRWAHSIGESKYIGISGKVTTISTTPEDIVFTWDVPAFPSNSIIKVSVEVLGLEISSPLRWLAGDYFRDFRLNSGSAVAQDITNEIYASRVNASTWDIDITFDNGILRPVVTVTGESGRTIDWSALMHITYAEIF